MTIPAYVDIGRLCHELSISERTADAWTRQGIIPAPKLRGGKRLWKWADVESALDGEGQSVPSSADAQAEGIRNATQQMAAEISANKRRNLCRGRPGAPTRRDGFTDFIDVWNVGANGGALFAACGSARNGNGGSTSLGQREIGQAQKAV